MEHRLLYCPDCGHITSKVHAYRTQLVKDVSVSGYHTIFHLRKRRHVCPAYGKRFAVRIDFLSRYRRFTHRAFMQVFEQFKECRSIKSIATANNMPPPAANVLNLIEYTVDKLPEVLSIDEFRGNA